MLEDFYSEFFPPPLARLAAPGLRELCGPPPGSRQAAWGEQRALEPEQRTGLSGEEPLRCREVLLVPQGGEGGPATSRGQDGVTVPGLSVGHGEQSAAAGKVPESGTWAASPQRTASAGTPSFELLVPDADDLEEAEDSRSKWGQPRRSPPARGEGAARARSPRTSLRADAASARLVPAAREAEGHKEERADTASPVLCQQNEVAAGDCGISPSPHSVTELQDQVVAEYWLPEE